MAVAGYAPVTLDRTGKVGKVPHLSDPQLRMNLVLAATSGMSRRGVAEFCGVSNSALKEWIARGKAEPDVEPYGSFSRDFLKATRCLEAAGATVLARRLDWLRKQPSHAVSPQEVKLVIDALAARYPQDHGTSKHREPETEITGDDWFEHHAMTHDQLVALLQDPPEAIGNALLASGDMVVARLLASGWEPNEALCAVVEARRTVKGQSR
jgi:hypothetical protein